MDKRMAVLGIILCTLTLLQTTPVVVRYWKFSDGEIFPWKSPHPPRLIPRSLEADLDGDGNPERVNLTGKTAKIQRVCRGANLERGCMPIDIWDSPPDWEVKHAAVTDLNRDRKAEVTLLVWRPFRPWPIDRYIPSGGRINDFHTPDGLSCHLILIGWEKGEYRELWAGSAMVRPFLSFSSGDLDGDGYEELAGVEGGYSRLIPAGNLLSIWEWNGFGFSRLGRLTGTYQTVGIARSIAAESILLTLN